MTGQGWYTPQRSRAGPRISIALGLFAVWLAVPGTAAEPASEAVAAEGAPKLIQPPEKPDAIRSLHEQVVAEMHRLAPSTQPAASAPTSQPSEVAAAKEAATALYNALQQLAERAGQLLALRTQLSELKSPEKIDANAKELETLQQQTKELEAKLADPPPYASEEEVKKAQADYDNRLADIRMRSAVRTERTKALASAPVRLQDAAAKVQKAQTDFQSAIARLTTMRDAAKTPVDRRRIDQEIRRAEIENSLPAFDEVILKLTQERDTILQGHAERRLPILRAMMTRFADWKNMLQQIHARGERERIQAELDFVARHPDERPVYEKTYWQLKLLAASAREELDKREQTLRARFVEFSGLDPKQDLPTEQASWGLLMESLARRPSDDIRDMYRDVEAAIQRWREKLAGTRRLLDRTVDDQREIATVTDDLDAKLRTKSTDFNQELDDYLAKHAGDAQAERLSQDFVESKARFTQQTQKLQLDASRLITRLKEANGMIESFVEQLEDYRSRLYWRHLYVPDHPLWSYRWNATKQEWRLPREQEQRDRDRRLLRSEGAAIGPVHTTVLVLAIALAAALAIGIRRRARRYADGILEHLAELKAPEGEHPTPISERLHLFASRYVARTIPLLLPAATILVLVCVFEMTGAAVTAIVAALLFIIGAALSEALLRLLFVPGKPRLRLLRCSNVVAGHYRRWGLALWIATVILAPLPLILWALDLAYGTRGYLWNLYKIVALLIVLMFGLRKQLVLRVVGRPDQIRHRGILALVSAVYPLLWAVAAVLVVAEIAGYASLVTYVVVSFAESVATIALAILFTRYVTDVITRYGRAAVPEAGTAADRGTAGGASEPAEEGTGGSDVVLQLAAAVIRWAVALGAIALILHYWGITGVEAKSVLRYELLSANSATGRAAITVASVLAAILSVVAAWWVSRSVRSLLDTRVFPFYAGIDRGARAAITTILHYLLMLLGLYFSLVAMRVPLGALTVVLGTVGLGVGLGLQPLFVNFISGLMILFERHVRVGDIVDVNGQVGEVTGISMRSTSVKTGDNIDLVVPNSDFITQRVVNWTYHESRLRGRVDVGVAYGTDEQLVKRLLLEIARHDPLVLTYPPPEVWFTDFGQSSLGFALVAWFRNAGDRGRFLNEIRFEITRVFRENHVEIPLPHQALTTAGGKPLAIQVIQPTETQRPDSSPPSANR